MRFSGCNCNWPIMTDNMSEPEAYPCSLDILCLASKLLQIKMFQLHSYRYCRIIQFSYKIFSIFEFVQKNYEFLSARVKSNSKGTKIFDYCLFYVEPACIYNPERIRAGSFTSQHAVLENRPLVDPKSTEIKMTRY